MAEFAYNNAQNTSTGHILFKLYYGYYPKDFFEENVDSYSKSRTANKLVEELRELIEVCCQKLFHVQELQKKAHNKEIKSCSYALGKKVWLNSKYIKKKRNKKLEMKFFGFFRVLHAVKKHIYKLELFTK